MPSNKFDKVLFAAKLAGAKPYWWVGYGGRTGVPEFEVIDLKRYRWSGGHRFTLLGLKRMAVSRNDLRIAMTVDEIEHSDVHV